MTYMNYSRYLRYSVSKVIAKIATGLFVFILFSVLSVFSHLIPFNPLIFPQLSFVAPCFSAIAHNNGIPLRLSDNTQALITILHNNVVAQLSNGVTLTLINDINKVPEYARDIWVEDFNFDGFKDIAVTTSIDAFSNDQIYTVFTWEKGLKQFIPIQFKSSLSNLEVLPRKREVRSSYQSGDFWTEDSYRFNNYIPYLYSKSELIINNVWHTTIYSIQGQPIRSLVSSDGRTDRPPQPVLLTVSSQVAPLYKSPVPSSLLPQQLNQGDTVTVLDFKRGIGRLNWVNIRSNHNNHILQGWILLSNLLHS